MSKPSLPRPDRLALGVTRRQAAIAMTTCPERLPCLPVACHAGKADEAIPADPFLMRDRGKARTPFHFAPDWNRLRELGNDDAGLAERKPTVSAAASDAKSTAASSP